jgi:hypothetical protein
MSEPESHADLKKDGIDLEKGGIDLGESSIDLEITSTDADVVVTTSTHQQFPRIPLPSPSIS